MGLLSGRNFCKELDFTVEEWRYLLDLAAELKTAKKTGTETKTMVGCNIALLFEKTSTRTRCSFEVAAHDQGANVTYLDPAGCQLGAKESIKDTARVLGRMFDGIEYRGFDQQRVETLAKYSKVPTWNGLTDQWHPTQTLADQLTMLEHSGKDLSEISFAFLGDCRNNVGNSLLIGGAMMGMDVRMVGPGELANGPEILAEANRIAQTTGAKITVTDDAERGVLGTDFIYTDIWVSMGEPKQLWQSRIELLKPYRVSSELMALSGNPQTKFMHCLPAYHDDQTDVGAQVAKEFNLSGGVEVADEVFESEKSIVFDQAENRMHTIKAVMVATLGNI